MTPRLTRARWAPDSTPLIALLLAAVAGCAPVGDFGRFRADNKKLERDPVVTGAVPSSFAFTDDERALREQARALLIGPDLPGKSPKLTDAALPWRGPAIVEASPQVYAEHLVRGPYRSAAARYAKLVDDTRNDVTRFEPFFSIARRVADLDRKREQSLGAVTAVSPQETLDARRRIRENMMLMTEVHRTLTSRAQMYRFALERLVIALPSPMAAEAERVRGELERRLASVQVTGGSAVELRPVAAAAVPHPGAVAK
ncbi:MAG: hypothetical protein IT538_08045 [Variibacter sp.]|nr:hypothetical protein [Variibacter sp.]